MPGHGQASMVGVWVWALTLVAASGGEAAHEVAAASLRCEAQDARAEEMAPEEIPAATEWRCGWPQARRSPRRTSYNDAEDRLSPDTVGALRRLWSAPVPATGPADARPIQVWTATPAVARGQVVAMNIDALFAIDVQSGAERWRQSPPAFDFEVASPLVVGSLAVVVPHRQGDPPTFEVLARDLATGERVWSLSGDGSTTSRRAASTDGVVYASVPGGDVVALAAADGSVRWVHGVADGQVGSPSVSAGRVLVPWAYDGVPESPRAVRALDADSGQLAWRADLACDLPLDSSPVADGRRVYVACFPHAGQAGGAGDSFADAEDVRSRRIDCATAT